MYKSTGTSLSGISPSTASQSGASRFASRAWRRTGLALAFSLAMLGMGSAHAEIDVNNADESALTSIKGIGPATAKRILDERSKNGAFKDSADLADRVPGVGPKSVASMQQAGLTFGKGAPAPAARKESKEAKATQKASTTR